MLKLKPATLTLSLVLFSLATTSLQADSKSPEEAAIEYRQSAFKMIKHHFGPMAGMVKGDIDYDAETFTKNAEAVAALSHFPINGFIDGTFGVDDTDAKADIADNKEDFNKKMETFQVKAADLAKTAESGDMGEIRPAFGAVAKSCKACHDSYREKN